MLFVNYFTEVKNNNFKFHWKTLIQSSDLVFGKYVYILHMKPFYLEAYSTSLLINKKINYDNECFLIIF